MKIECELETLRQGWPTGLELSVTNDDASRVLVLDAAEWEAPLRGRHAWGKQALGCLRYESLSDEYVLATSVGLQAPLALHGGILLPEFRARTLLPSACLAAGESEAALRVGGWSFPLAEFAERVYQVDPVSAARPVQRFRRGEAPSGQVRDAWVHLKGAQPVEGRLRLQVRVEPDPAAPAALERVAGGSLVKRLRRLGGAWVVIGPRGSWTLARGTELARLSAMTVDLPCLEALDRDPPFLPLDLVFRGAGAEAFRDSGELPLVGAGLGQQRLESAHLWELLVAADREGLSLRWGRHATIAAGLIVSSEAAETPPLSQ